MRSKFFSVWTSLQNTLDFSKSTWLHFCISLKPPSISQNLLDCNFLLKNQHAENSSKSTQNGFVDNRVIHRSKWPQNLLAARSTFVGVVLLPPQVAPYDTLHVKVAGKIPCPNLSPERGQSLCASLRGRNAYQHFARATLYRNLQEKCRGPEPRTTLCASLRNRNALCASLRNRNALGDFTRATGKCRGPAGAPWSSTGLYSYRKNPSVWTHSLAKYT